MAKPKPLPPLERSDVARFWPKVSVAGSTECWEWTAGRFRAGYGAFQVAGRAVKAHRVAYFLATGTDPTDDLVCHSCDNRPCCNPAHMFIGDHLANRMDCAAKGRMNSPKGSRAFGCRLIEADVIAIRAAYETGTVRQATLAAKYGVSKMTISSVITGTNWKHLPVLLKSRRRVDQDQYIGVA